MIRNGEASLDAAVERLNRAVEALEVKVAAQTEALIAGSAPADDEAVHIALRETRLREKALESAAAEASLVLGRAAERIRSALEDEDADAEGSEDGFFPDDDPDSLDHLSDDQTDMHPREF